MRRIILVNPVRYVLACTRVDECGMEYSANPSDYWAGSDAEPMECECGSDMAIVRMAYDQDVPDEVLSLHRVEVVHPGPTTLGDVRRLCQSEKSIHTTIEVSD